MERSLFYAKVGVAFADTAEVQQGNFNNRPLLFGLLSNGFREAPPGGSAVNTFSTGWTVGGGYEYAITNN